MSPWNEQDRAFMQQALALAATAPALGEVPIAALVVHDGVILAQAHNRRETDQDPTAHAEMVVIQAAAKRLKSWRLIDCTLYVTLEPCTMCIGAIVLARIPRLVYAASDPKAGACGSILNIPSESRLNHRVTVESGLFADDSRALLQNFFRHLRRDLPPSTDP